MRSIFSLALITTLAGAAVPATPLTGATPTQIATAMKLRKYGVRTGMEAKLFQLGYEKGLRDAFSTLDGTAPTFGEINASGFSNEEIQACFTCGAAIAREGLKLLK